jgi:Protein of unknown function (DUF4232)
MQTPLLLRLLNHGSRACTLHGYPRIKLDGPSSTAYPFAYRDAGDQEVTNHLPGTVTLQVGASAWILINKNACVANDRGRVATKLQLAPPGSNAFLRVALARAGPYLDYCERPDPGHHIEVSPVEATASRTMAF